MKVHEFVLRMAVSDDSDASRALERLHDCVLELCGDARDKIPGRVQIKLVLTSTNPIEEDRTDLAEWHQAACRTVGKDNPVNCFEDFPAFR